MNVGWQFGEEYIDQSRMRWPYNEVGVALFQLLAASVADDQLRGGRRIQAYHTWLLRLQRLNSGNRTIFCG